MLLNIREHAKGWIAWLLVGALVFVFALWGIADYVGGDGKSTPVAKVNDEEISAQDVQIVYERLSAEQRALKAANKISAPMDAAQLRQRALQGLVSNAVLIQAIRKRGFIFSNQQINDILLHMPEFQEEGQFSQQRFEQVAAGAYYSPQKLRSEIVNSMLINQLRIGVIDSAFLLPSESKRLYQLTEQSRDFNYLTVPAQQFAKDVTVNTKQMQAYYQAHKNSFVNQEQVSLDYVMLKRSDFDKDAHISDDDTLQYYEEHKKEYATPKLLRTSHILIALPNDATREALTQAKKKLSDILARIKNGESFSAMAKEFSDDAGTKNKGGDLGWYSYENMFPEMAQVAFKLAKVGELSPIVQTQFGLHLIQLTGIRPENQIPYAQKKEDIAKLLRNNKLDELYNNALDEATTLAFENADSLADLAGRFNVSVQKTPLFTRQGLKRGILANSQVKELAFSDDVLLNHNNSDVIELNDHSAVIIRVHEHKLPAPKPFDEVKETIKIQLTQQLTQEKTRQVGEKLWEAFKKGEKTLQQIAEKDNFDWKDEQRVTRTANRVQAEIRDAVFRLPQPSNKQPSRTAISLSNGDYVIIVLTAVHLGDSEKNKESYEKFSEYLTQLMGAVDYQGYKNALANAADIEMYKSDDGEAE